VGRFGLDEVGRGALAGPVAVGLVYLADQDEVAMSLFPKSGEVQDSKHLSHRQREDLATRIRELFLCSVGVATAQEVDRDGIVKATQKAADRAIEAVMNRFQPETVCMADAGLRHSYQNTFHTTNLVRGDEQECCIALASILAKVIRDSAMQEYDLAYPGYGFAKHKGYGTTYHGQQIVALGMCDQHRVSFLQGILSQKT
jgi:ribonuclease HII